MSSVPRWSPSQSVDPRPGLEAVLTLPPWQVGSRDWGIPTGLRVKTASVVGPETAEDSSKGLRESIGDFGGETFRGGQET